MSFFARQIIEASPPWLRRTFGRLFMQGLVDEADTISSRTAEGLKARYPTDARPEALGPIGLDRVVLRAPGESDASYAQRLITAHDYHRRAGKISAIPQAIDPLGVSVLVVEDHMIGGLWGHWARFVVYVDAGASGLFDPALWDDGHAWDGGIRWDFADGAAGDYLVAVVRLLKPAHARCLGIVVLRDGYDPVIVPVDPNPGIDIPTTPPVFYLDSYLDMYLGG